MKLRVSNLLGKKTLPIIIFLFTAGFLTNSLIQYAYKDKLNFPTKDQLYKAALQFPGVDSSDESIKLQNCLTKTLAKATGTLEIGPGCSTTPEILELKLNSVFIVRNRDGMEHLLRSGDTEMRIPRNASKEYSANFGKGVGNFAYTCDDGKNNMGIIRIIDGNQSF